MRRSLSLSGLLGVGLAAFVHFAVPPSADGAESAWSRAKSPADGPSLSIGGYNAGCVQGAKELPATSTGYRIMKPERRRIFGHPLLVDFIQQLGTRLEAEKLGPLAVGDLGQARGGPAPNGHASHQNGLDVDLWFSAGTAGAEQQSMVDFTTQTPSQSWSPRVPQMLQLAASDPRVARIFVNAVIKRELCLKTEGDRAWLGKLRPWWGHNEHFHVRLSCPSDSPECQPQAPLASGDGCDELDWWLGAESAEARQRGVETYGKRVGAQPKLPDRCNKLAR
jgi:penicillin-insensitive murein endopeptidase